MTTTTPPRILILMGVSGCGKSTLGQRLAQHLGWDFFDADDFHPPVNVAKMASGMPLTDADRAPWLAALRQLLLARLDNDAPAVLACSALKQRYRDELLAQHPAVQFIYLQGDFATFYQRVTARAHYMPPTLLQSQFEALEPPTHALTLDATLPPATLIAVITRQVADLYGF